jgi:regulator of replication initiation timing
VKVHVLVMSSYADQRRTVSRPYGYATYATNRAPPPGGPAALSKPTAANTTVTTAVVLPSRRSTGATQFGLLEYDTHDYYRPTGGAAYRSASSRSVSCSTAESAQAATSAATKAQQSKAAAVHHPQQPPARSHEQLSERPADFETLKAARLRQRRDLVRAAADLDSEDGESATAVSADSTTRESPPARRAPVDAATTRDAVVLHRSPQRSRTPLALVATPIPVGNMSSSLAVADPLAAPGEVAVEYTTRVLRRDDLRGPDQHEIQGTAVTVTGGAPYVVTESEQRAATEHFHSAHRHTAPHHPLESAVRQADRIEKRLDEVAIAAEAAAAAVQSLQDDTLHRDAVRRTAEEERDVANASALEAVVNRVGETIVGQVDESADGRFAVSRALLADTAKDLTDVVERETRRVLAAAQQQHEDALAAASRTLEEATKRSAKNATDALERMLFSEPRGGGSLDARIRADIEAAVTQLLQRSSDATRQQLRDVTADIIAQHASVDATSREETAKRLREAQQAIVRDTVLAVERCSQNDVTAVGRRIDDLITSNALSQQAAGTATAQIVGAARDDVVQTVVNETTRLRSDADAALAETKMVRTELQHVRSAVLDMDTAHTVAQRRLDASTAEAEANADRRARELLGALDRSWRQCEERLQQPIAALPDVVARAMPEAMQTRLDDVVGRIVAVIDRGNSGVAGRIESSVLARITEANENLANRLASATEHALEGDTSRILQAVHESTDRCVVSLTAKLEKIETVRPHEIVASVEHATQSAARLIVADVCRETSAALTTHQQATVRHLSSAADARSEATQRAIESALDHATSRIVASTSTAVESALRSSSEQSTSSLHGAASRIAADAVQAAHGKVLSAVEDNVRRVVADGLTPFRASLNDIAASLSSSEGDRRLREQARARELDGILSELRDLKHVVVTSQQQQQQQQQQRSNDAARWPTGPNVTRLRDRYEGNTEAAEGGTEAAAPGGALQDVTALAKALRELRTERDASAAELERLREAVSRLETRKVTTTTDAIAAEERRNAALDAAATAERDVADLHSRLASLRDQEAEVRASLAAAQAQVSSVATLREVMLRDVKRLSAAGISGASSRAPSADRASSRHSSTVTPPTHYRHNQEN